MQFRSRRKPTDYPAVLLTDDGELPVEVADANSDGIRARLPENVDLPVDAIVSLVLRGGRYPAVVVWSRDGSAGLAFQRPLPADALAIVTRERQRPDARQRRFLMS